MKPITIVNTTFVPVYTAPKKQVETLIPIPAKKEGPVETFKVDKITYIPRGIIPKTFLPLFKPIVPVNKV